MNDDTEPKDYFCPEHEAAFLDEEWDCVRKLRGHPAGDGGAREDLVGLALSGGGIRSASFALGVLQGLVRADVLKRVDYLSTVSGGGYTGSSLTWFLSREWISPPAGVDKNSFPIGQIYKSSRADMAAKNIRAAILSYIRQHGNYLNPESCINLISQIGVVLRSVILALAVYFTLVVVLLFVLGRIGAALFEQPWAGQLGWLGPGMPIDLRWLLALALLLAAVFLLMILSYSLFTVLKFRFIPDHYGARLTVECWLGWVLSLVVLFALLGFLPKTAAILNAAAPNLWKSGVVAGISTILGALGAFVNFFKRGESGAGKILGSGGLAFVAAALLFYGVLLLAYRLANVVFDLKVAEQSVGGFVAGGLAVFALVLGFFVNLNCVSLHRMYRDRLMETFLPDHAAVQDNRWRPATQADGTLLESLIIGGHPGPYHLINTNVVLIDADHAKHRGRGGDSFVLSSLFCGGYATGWRRTADYMKNPFSRGMTLPTALAISGAAVNPGTGVGGRGITRNRLLSFLMTMMNIRLGYWAPNPRYKGNLIVPPNYFVPGFKGLRGKGFDETSFFVELTDGGHFENIGLYELIRRRAKIIIVSDAAADPEFRFSDFGNAVERVRVDFSVDIRFTDADKDLRGIMPGSAKKSKEPESEAAFRRMYDLAERGYAIGEIKYPPRGDAETGKTGKIVYIKSTLTKNLPADIYGYKSAHPSFPDQPTSDQFFDENQFEAYRELGYRLTRGIPWEDVLSPPSDKKRPSKKAPDTQG